MTDTFPETVKPLPHPNETALRQWVAHLDAAREGAVRSGSPAAAMAWAVQEIDHLRGRLAEARDRADAAETLLRLPKER